MLTVYVLVLDLVLPYLKAIGYQSQPELPPQRLERGLAEKKLIYYDQGCQQIRGGIV